VVPVSVEDAFVVRDAETFAFVGLKMGLPSMMLMVYVPSLHGDWPLMTRVSGLWATDVGKRAKGADGCADFGLLWA
jgi:hypothetical protein